MAGNSSRSTLIREGERAQGNLEWFGTHINNILQSYVENVQWYIENNQPIPEQYEIVITGCDTILTVSQQLLEAVKTMREHM